MRDPIFIINFKTYRNGTGKRALVLANVAEDIALETNTNICVAVEAASIYMISKMVTIPVFAQHVDCIDFGSYTGHILAESIKEHGGKGTLLNHPEKKIDRTMLAKYLRKCRATGLKSVVCVSSINEGKEAARLNPDFIALEDEFSIDLTSRIRPEFLSQFVSEFSGVHRCGLLCATGIFDGNDVRTIMRLGMDGIIVSSSIVNSQKPREKIMDMAHALRQW
jgi:triosephosphate isomerase